MSGDGLGWYRRFTQRESEVGGLEAARELREAGVSEGCRLAARTCPGECPNSLRHRLEYLLRSARSLVRGG